MKIKITAKKSPEHVDVELDVKQIYNIVRNALLDVYGLEDGERLCDGNVVVFDAPTSYESEQSRMRIIRKADPRDVEGLTALANLAAWYRRKTAEEQESDDS